MSKFAPGAFASDEEVANLLRDCLNDAAEMINILESRGWAVNPVIERPYTNEGRGRALKKAASVKITRNQSL